MKEIVRFTDFVKKYGKIQELHNNEAPVPVREVE